MNFMIINLNVAGKAIDFHHQNMQ